MKELKDFWSNLEDLQNAVEFCKEELRIAESTGFNYNFHDMEGADAKKQAAYDLIQEKKKALEASNDAVEKKRLFFLAYAKERCFGYLNSVFNWHEAGCPKQGDMSNAEFIEAMLAGVKRCLEMPLEFDKDLFHGYGPRK